ncbi:MAG: S8 family serine peptidase, partial [Phycisphaerae bacterium]
IVAPLSRFGLDADNATAWPVTGWVLAPAVFARQSPTGIQGIVKQISDQRAAAFVSPVFVDDFGGPLIVTPILLVGFRRDIPTARAEAILAASGAGVIEQRDWANMERTYALRSPSRGGFDVLDAANRLAQRPEVRFAEPDMIFTGRGSLIPNDTLFGDLWGLHNTGQFGGTPGVDMDLPEAWDITTGDPSVLIVVIDTGVQQDHPDINQITPGLDLTGESGGGGPVNACDRHGTWVAGCVAAKINNNLGVVGTCPDCRVASARAFISVAPCSGDWTAAGSWTVDALAWAESIGARITNNSNGYGFTSAAIDQKYQDTRNAGLIHFASAGNNAIPQLDYPSRLPTVNAVAALDRFGDLASFSSFGDGLAFSAPGSAIFTTDRTGSASFPGDYTLVNGTSFATPYTAGVVGLMLSADPILTVTAVEVVLQQSSVDLGAAGYDTTFGWGFVNAALALSTDPPACLPAAAPLPGVIRGKNRYLSFNATGLGADRDNGTAGRAAALQAVRITYVDIPPPNDHLNGAVAWVAAPQPISENGGAISPIPGFPAFNASNLTCGPVFMDWGAVGTVHVSHQSIIPGGMYAIQILNETCPTALETSFSAPLTVTMSRYGDVAGAFDQVNRLWIEPDGVVGITSDVIAIVDKFGGRVGAPIKARADLEPATPDRLINITDAVEALDAFRGKPYPFAAGPPPCAP